MSHFSLSIEKAKPAIIGLGYVGLPLALAFGKKYDLIAFDISSDRISEISKGKDKTFEVEKESLLNNIKCQFTNDEKQLVHCNTYIITVPTPLKKTNKPDLSFLESASKLVGKFLDAGDVVIFESTVYPGVTEEFCAPIIEKISSLKYNKEFFVGYSPERINPGDKSHRLKDIIKVTSGSNDSCANYVNDLYSSIITAGTYKAKDIKTAEAAKLIENVQRDINIALVNELAILFKKLEINTKNVLETASTKWNFLSFKPGLVGGHCIGVDPYYLTHKAKEVDYNPKLILAGRKLNDDMANYVSENLMLELIKKHGLVSRSTIITYP